MNRKDFVPLLQSSFLFLAVLVLATVRFRRAPSLWAGCAVNGDILFVGLYLLWLLLEIGVAGRDLHAEGPGRDDRATCTLYGAGQALTVLSALAFPTLWRAPGMVHVVGILLFALGVSYRWWAILTLGRFYSHRVRQVDEHRIVDTGPYRYTRHPAYGGMIAAQAGLSLFFFNAATAGVFLLVFVPAILLRIVTEEKMLFGMEGYAAFATTRKRLVPGIW